MANGKNSLREGLMVDIAANRARQRQGQEARGAREVPGGTRASRFETKALRTQRKTIGQAEFQKANNAIQNTVSSLLTEANLADKVRASQIQSDLTDKLQQMKLTMIKRAGLLEKKLAREKVSREKRARIMGLLQSTVANATSLAIGNLGAGSGSQGGSGVQSPQFGSQFAEQPSNFGGFGLDLDV